MSVATSLSKNTLNFTRVSHPSEVPELFAQAAQRYLEKGNAFGVLVHDGQGRELGLQIGLDGKAHISGREFSITLVVPWIGPPLDFDSYSKVLLCLAQFAILERKSELLFAPNTALQLLRAEGWRAQLSPKISQSRGLLRRLGVRIKCLVLKSSTSVKLHAPHPLPKSNEPYYTLWGPSLTLDRLGPLTGAWITG